VYNRFMTHDVRHTGDDKATCCGSRRRYRNETKPPLDLLSHSVKIGKSNSRNQRHDDVEDVEQMYCRSTLNTPVNVDFVARSFRLR
jgi:hypothetical protein